MHDNVKTYLLYVYDQCRNWCSAESSGHRRCHPQVHQREGYEKEDLQSGHMQRFRIYDYKMAKHVPISDREMKPAAAHFVFCTTFLCARQDTRV